MYCGERVTRSDVSLPPTRAEASDAAPSRGGGGGGGSGGGGSDIQSISTAASVVALVLAAPSSELREPRERVRVLGYR